MVLPFPEVREQIARWMKFEKNVNTLVFAVLLRAFSAGGQQISPPQIEWQRSFGGSNIEFYPTIKQTADGGYYFAGLSHSCVSGNKTSPGITVGGPDIWVVRLDRDGNKLWEQTLGGNRSEDSGVCLQPTRDGGFIVAATSPSGVSGNKTVASFGDVDFWIIKLGPDALTTPPRLRPLNQSALDIRQNGYRLALSGVSNQNYRIERTTDFVSWTPFQTNRVSLGNVEVIDPGAGSAQRNFYRVTTVP
jgi:hypothetical protein